MNNKSILRITCLYIFIMAIFSCASSTSNSSNVTVTQKTKTASVTTLQSDEQLPFIEADIEVFPQLGHTRGPGSSSTGINSIAFSPDGRLVVSCSSDRTIKLWETATGREIRTFSWASWTNQDVETVSFSPDGKQVLGSGGQRIILLDTATGQTIRSF